MGRHSASADDEDESSAAVDASALDLAPRRRGRHSSAEDEADDQPTQMIAVVDPGLLEDGNPHDTAVTGELPVLDPPSSADTAALERDSAAAAEQEATREATQRAADQAAEAAAEEAARKAAEKAAAKAAADERKAADRAAKQAAKAEKKATRGESETQADLRLLRSNSAVRAQLIGSVVVAFGLYTLVLAVIGKMSNYALFVFVPIVVSGVLVGIVLDLAHRRASRPAPEPLTADVPGAAEKDTGEVDPQKSDPA